MFSVLGSAERMTTCSETPINRRLFWIQNVSIPLLFCSGVSSGEFSPFLRFRSCIIRFYKLPWRNGGSKTKFETGAMCYILYSVLYQVFFNIYALYLIRSSFFLFLLFLLKACVHICLRRNGYYMQMVCSHDIGGYSSLE